jgi:hypothetical protein
VADTLKIGQTDAQARITEMIAAQQLHGRIRAAITEITQRLWGDLSAEDLATAGRVLAIINERASTELNR